MARGGACRLQVLLLSKLLGGAVRVGALWCLEVGLLQAIMLALPTPSIAALAHTCKVQPFGGEKGPEGWQLRGLSCLVSYVLLGRRVVRRGRGRTCGPSCCTEVGPSPMPAHHTLPHQAKAHCIPIQSFKHFRPTLPCFSLSLCVCWCGGVCRLPQCPP